MIPTSFDESEHVLSSDTNEVLPLSIARKHSEDGTPLTISCWKLTAEDLAEITRTGRMWLVFYGVTHPPVIPTSTRPPELDQGVIELTDLEVQRLCLWKHLILDREIALPAGTVAAIQRYPHYPPVTIGISDFGHTEVRI